MQIFAFLDPEFWYIMFKQLWPVLAVPYGLGLISTWLVKKTLNLVRK